MSEAALSTTTLSTGTFKGYLSAALSGLNGKAFESEFKPTKDYEQEVADASANYMEKLDESVFLKKWAAIYGDPKKRHPVMIKGKRYWACGSLNIGRLIYSVNADPFDHIKLR